MQTHFQMGQAPQPMVGGFSHSMNGMSPLPKAWHGASDNGLIRQEIVSQIIHLLQQRGVERNLHNVAKELEGALYVDASTKEEYGDLDTLEFRICSLMMRLRKAQNTSQPGAQLSSQSPKAQIPNFSGMLSPGSSASMLPPGSGGGFYNPNSFALAANHDGNGFGRSIVGYNGVTGLSGSGNGQYRPTSSVQNTGSWMVPTPGLNLRNNGISSNVTDITPFGRSSDFSFSPTSAYQYHGGRISPGGLLNNNVLGVSSFSNNLTNMRQSFIGGQSHHHVQSLLQQRLVGTEGQMVDGNYSMEGNNVYNTMLNTAVPSNSTSSVLSEQQDRHVSQGFPLQNLPSASISTESNVSSFIPNYEKEKSLAFSTPSNRRMSGDSGTTSMTAFAPAVDHCTVLQSNTLQSFESQGNQEVNWVENSAEKECQLQSDLQKSQPSYVQLLYEHACQANSADTGQSEVVSNDEAPSQVKEIGDLQPTQELKRPQWLLILLWHVNRCSGSESCSVPHCPAGQKMWTHLKSCKLSKCSSKCTYVKAILRHHQSCRNVKCPVCGPVRTYVARHTEACRNKMSKQPEKPMNECGIGTMHNDSDSIPPLKRMKVGNIHTESMEQDGQKDVCCTSPRRVLEVKCESPIESSLSQRSEEDGKPDIFNEGKVHISNHVANEGKVHSSNDVVNDWKVHNSNDVLDDGKVQSSNDVIDDEKMSNSNVKDTTIVKPDILKLSETDGKSNIHSTAVVTKVASDSSKIAKTKISGISYVENFSPELIRQHISSLRKWIGQSRCKAEKNQAMQHHMLPSACSACAVEDLYFDPIPIFCTQCGCRIKRNATYYSSGAGENSLSFCGPCYNSIKSDTVETDGFKVKKSMLLKKKNDETRAEGWVECDKCKKWQHQICVLFNARMNKERSEYICPECCIEEMEGGQRVHGSVNSVLGAKDLPSTVLSNYIQERLCSKLHEERVERAQALGKSLEEVPTAEGLVVRVLSSVDKKLDVKPRFLELFQEENYPKDFLYKSKMLMLFQDIEGVEVCLFGMYVQEFGADIPQPNHRWVYLSYLDSVKYFRPDVRTLKGEALRTFVYHEILIGYLDYCKKRGFSSCYIWACPPLKGDDYILYCHPEIQKTPKPDKLREWYLNMISKAKRENIVVANKNLYDYFFTSNGDCKAKITATRLPYFDGDYWPGAAEDLLHQLQQEDDGLDPRKSSKMKKIISKRTTKTSAQAELGGNVSMDLQLMHKLGQSIVAMKEDFIIVQLHNVCSRCRTFIYSGYRWVCHQCSGNFQLCSSCYEEHQTLDEEDKHPAGKRESHLLAEEEIDGIPAETVDNDDIMESEFFDNRQSFLSLCQGNQYQFDTLRRAKHSSMMILYHLHNPNAPAFITSCSVCHSELEAGQGYRCKSCTDFDVCHICYTSSEDVKRHPHAFMPRSTQGDSNSGSATLRKQRMLQMRMMLEVLVHASKCRDASCQFAKCRNMKDLFRHGQLCSKRANGGCPFCKRIWFLLTAHARGCKESVCSVPRCMDLRKHFKRTQLQQESRRRAAVNEMIRQRAAEAAGCQ